MEPKRPPRDYLIRAQRPGVELRSAKDGGMPTMFGYFARIGEWARISSMWEGDFMERSERGSFVKTIKENRANMRVTLNHGSDPVAGDKPLGPITELREDETGPYYEVPLLNTSYNHDILPGLEAGLYGASRRLRVMKERFVEKPGRSDHNPEGIPERTILEEAVEEFGPVTFPAYQGASAGVRSLTDDYIVRQLMGDPDKLAQLMAHYSRTALPGAESATHSEVGSRVLAPVPVKRRFQTQEGFLSWLNDRA